MNHDREADAIEIARIAGTLCAGNSALHPLEAVMKAQDILKAARAIVAPKPSPEPSSDILNELVETMGDRLKRIDDAGLKLLGIDPEEPWDGDRRINFKAAAGCIVTETTKVRTKKDGRWLPEKSYQKYLEWFYFAFDCFGQNSIGPHRSFLQDLEQGTHVVPITYWDIKVAATAYGLELPPVEISHNAAKAWAEKWKADSTLDLGMLARDISLYPKWLVADGEQRTKDGGAGKARELKAANELATKGQPRKKKNIVDP